MVAHHKIKRDEDGNFGLFLTDMKPIDRAKYEGFLLNPDIKVNMKYAEDGSFMCIIIK